MYSYDSFEEVRGPRIHLTRLRPNDIEEVAKALFSPTTWVVAAREINTPEKLHKYLADFVEKDDRGEGLTLVARENATNEVLGLSRFHSAGPNFFKVEIGYTWVADRWHRTFVNTEKKQLMLQYAFETMKVKRVEFSVDPKNEKSNSAMKRLGATLEGTLRKWRFLSEKDLGHRNLYSIIDDEWPQVKAGIENLRLVAAEKYKN